MNERQIARALTRIAHEVLERNVGAESLAVVGVLTRGAFLAKRIAAIIEELEGVKVPVGLMDIGLYRDDVHTKGEQPVVQRTDILFSVKDKNIILVDDVLFTGRTVRAALNHINDFGRPRTIQLAVLVDRGHRELPIRADYVGINIPTARGDQVVLEVKEKEGSDRVYVVRDDRGGAAAMTTKKASRKKAAKKSAKSNKSKESASKKGGRS
ncbi:bifunctional pyr operon transcriptional regulator/uracil phosphoribosyltransferase PyrR [candidate division GN15 bacterium]|nr:bifunctional pyr operon transcriptional regulator/uracil phosphoribosyltransferase PyrR [candidate division GN15 bacterium]